MILEEREQALAREARILCEIAGYGCTSDAFHITSPEESGTGPVRAMQAALGEAGLHPSSVAHVNAHGTGTRLNDEVEATALAALFGDHAVPITSTKGVTGHLLGAAGAAGAVEAVFAALTLADGRIPPTAHFRRPDPSSRIDIVHGAPRHSSTGLRATTRRTPRPARG
ncbi:3-oxoacyl-ACP synthase [Streptomyces sp. FIT100]|uniref:3-oxoacyl-ACP synthase n=1 Tax=Streptomyces sp. FIT100 TaxID=2837956 RepID=UPI0021C77FCD|nr:3-oxoacyl-ACP synthase [Streptomyces sp. FIT100]